MGSVLLEDKLKMSVKYPASYMLAELAGNASKESMTNILNAAGAEVEAAIVDVIFASLVGKDIEEVVADGMSKLSTISSGSGAPAAVGGAAEAVEEEKKESSEESSDAEMGFSLFD